MTFRIWFLYKCISIDIYIQGSGTAFGLCINEDLRYRMGNIYWIERHETNRRRKISHHSFGSWRCLANEFCLGKFISFVYIEFYGNGLMKSVLNIKLVNINLLSVKVISMKPLPGSFSRSLLTKKAEYSFLDIGNLSLSSIPAVKASLRHEDKKYWWFTMVFF